MALDDFLDVLDEDLGWRKKEISELFGLCQSQDIEVLRKSTLLMIYSHWEGFIKNAAKSYLSHVSDLKIKLGMLTINYRTIDIKGVISSCSQSQDTLTLSNELMFMKNYAKHDSKNFTLDKKYLLEKNKSLINTHDNLSPSVFTNFCCILGLSEKDAIASKKNYLDESFLGNRNSISHGSKITFDEDSEFDLSISSIERLKNIILTIMDKFKDDLQEYAIKEYYLSANEDDKLEYDQTSDSTLKSNLKELS